MIPLRAEGLLKGFADAGVLHAADVHVATRIGRLGGESRDEVLLAAALAVRGVRLGSVCVDLATVADTVVVVDDDEQVEDAVALPWPASWEALDDSPIVAVGLDAAWRPLRLVAGLLYLDRYWQQEQLVRRELDRRAATPVAAVDFAPLAALFGDPGPDRQRLAVAVAASRSVSVITGGPGTGKTHTVARLLKLLHDQPGAAPRIALAAPTGKAAARLEETVNAQADQLGLASHVTASTLHRLLGWRPDSRSRFRHDATNHLPYDVVVVDESSMVSLTLMARLLDAVRPSARLILVGDPDQLSPVDAGAVLNDLVHRPAAPDAVSGLPPGVVDGDLDLDPEEADQLRNGVVRLRGSHRYGAGIGALGEAIRDGDADRAVDLLASEPELTLTESTEELRAEVVDVATSLRQSAAAGDSEDALQLLGKHRVLCAHRHGPFGVSHWNDVIAAWSGAAAYGAWEPGTPFLVTANDRENNVFNGDTGVVMAGQQAVFAKAGALTRTLSMSRLSGLQVAHAMTVHRGQGSQYQAVTVILPTESSALLTRELLYTAVTRAQARVRVIGSEAAVRAAVDRPSLRASGLGRSLGQA